MVFRDQHGHVQGLATFYVDDILLAFANTEEAQQIFEAINGLYECGNWESGTFAQCGANIVQEYDHSKRQWGGFTVSLADYAEDIQLIEIPWGRRRQREYSLGPAELTSVRTLLGQLQWLAQQASPRSMAALSLLMGGTASATAESILNANKLARRALHEATSSLQTFCHHDPVLVTFSDASCMIRNHGIASEDT